MTDGIVPSQDDQWEEIDPQEVEMIVSALDQLIETAKSHNIKSELQAASDNIAEFAEWEDDASQADAA